MTYHQCVELNIWIPFDSFFGFIRTGFLLQISHWADFFANLHISLKKTNISLKHCLFLIMLPSARRLKTKRFFMLVQCYISSLTWWMISVILRFTCKNTCLKRTIWRIFRFFLVIKTRTESVRCAIHKEICKELFLIFGWTTKNVTFTFHTCSYFVVISWNYATHGLINLV